MATEIDQVYNRLQESHKIIAELTGLLNRILTGDPKYNLQLWRDIREAIHKYQHITGE